MSYSLGDNVPSYTAGISRMTSLIKQLDGEPRPDPGFVRELCEDRLHPSQVLSWLQCALCVAINAPSTLLNRPITLRCGHSLCSHHFPPSSSQAPLCPIQGCPRVSTSFSDGPIALRIASSPAGGPPVGTDVRLAQIVTLALESAPIFSTGSPKQALFRESLAETEQAKSTGEQQQRAVGPGLDPGLPIDNGGADSIPPTDRKRNRPEHHENLANLPSEASSKYIRSLIALTTCAICINPLVDPITTCCQHTFCSECLFRALDHSQNCPICRYQFNNVAEFYEYRVNQILATILSAIASSTTPPAVRRGSDHELDMPIFVCQLSFPGMPTILHIFEPRYRLMLRRVLASREPRFGMIMYPTHEGLTVNYGTMLEVSSIHVLADGRSVVQTMGTHRFKINKRKEMDGYLLAKVARFDDLSAAMEMELEKNATLLIPPRTPPILPTLSSPPLPGPKPTEVVGSEGEHQRPTDHNNVSLLQSRVRRRSNSPSPSIASVTSISTLSSIRSAPSSSSNTVPSPGPQFQRPSLMRIGRGWGSVGNNRTTNIQGIPVLNSLRSTYNANDNRAAQAPMFTYPIEPSTEELIATCQAFIQRLRSGSSQHVRDRMSRVGPVPTDTALLSFWIAQLLPIDEGEKAKLLPIRSPRLRLRLVVHWIDQFNAAWSFSGCIVS